MFSRHVSARKTGLCGVAIWCWPQRSSPPFSAFLGDLKLTVLNLGRTRITDAGLAHLGGFKTLTHLYLFDVLQITDAGLMELKNLEKLTDLNVLNDRGITDDGVRAFREFLPNVQIRR